MNTNIFKEFPEDFNNKMTKITKSLFLCDNTCPHLHVLNSLALAIVEIIFITRYSKCVGAIRLCNCSSFKS